MFGELRHLFLQSPPRPRVAGQPTQDDPRLARVRRMGQTEGRKDDQDQPRLELVPPELVFGVGQVLTFGAKKYSDRNWEKGMSWGRVFGALMRHMWAWWGGAGPTTKSFLFGDLDDETGFSHLWHAGCCLSFLIAYEERSVGADDRFRDPA